MKRTESLLDAIEKWKVEKPNYIKLTDTIKFIIDSELKKNCIFAHVFARTKDDFMLVKNLISKQNKTYATLTDKSGIRIICRFKDILEKLK
jgi:ppGpp synthetase/RelA/SpoT-type nucleotidyltranferase